jgi:hypothetical protein
MMEHIKFTTQADDIHDLEAIVEEEFPGSVSAMKQGRHLWVIQDAVAANNLTNIELHRFGALLKLATLHGNTVFVGDFAGVMTFRHMRIDRKNYGKNVQESP